MRIITVTSFLLVASLQGAFALKPASQSDLDAIEKQLADAKRLDENINAAIKKYSEAAADVKTTGAKRLELDKVVEREMAKQRAARTKAIHMVILAYDLAPASLNGTSVMRWTKDRTITWLPVAGEAEDRQLQNVSGRLKKAKKPPERYSGVTFPDGVTYIPESTFKNGAGFLASVLFHERTHFEQYTTKGMGDVMSQTEREVNAYQKQLDNAQLFLDPVKDEDTLKEIKLLLNAKKSEVHEENSLLGRIRRHLPSNDQPDKSELTVHTNVELADISGLVARARSQADIARRDREERETINKAAAEQSVRRDHDERLRHTLIEMAQRSCADPGSVTQAELDALPDPYQEDFKTSQGTPRGLDVCAYMVYLDLSRGVSSERIRSQATPTKPADTRAIPPPIREPVAAAATVPFNSIFPLLKDLAVTACASPAQVSITAGQFRRSVRVDFSRIADDAIAASLSTGLGDCPRQLFYKLIETVRAGQESIITDQWVRSMAAVYSPPVYVPPPSGGGDPCRDNRNIRCP